MIERLVFLPADGGEPLRVRPDAFGRIRPGRPMKAVWFRRPAWRLGPHRIFHGGYRQRRRPLGPQRLEVRQLRRQVDDRLLGRSAEINVGWTAPDDFSRRQTHD